MVKPARFATIAAVRVGVRAFEGLGRPWEAWWYDGNAWVAGRRRFTRSGALAEAYTAASAHVAAREREVAEAPGRIVALAQREGNASSRAASGERPGFSQSVEPSGNWRAAEDAAEDHFRGD